MKTKEYLNFRKIQVCMQHFGPNRTERRKRLRLRTRMSRYTWNDIYARLYPGKIKNRKSILGKIKDLIMG